MLAAAFGVHIAISNATAANGVHKKRVIVGTNERNIK
jgi:hypothetical protein